MAEGGIVSRATDVENYLHRIWRWGIVIGTDDVIVDGYDVAVNVHEVGTNGEWWYNRRAIVSIVQSVIKSLGHY